MRSSAVLVGLATLVSACGTTDTASDLLIDPPASTASIRSTTSLAATAASSAELAYRTELLPWPTDDGLSPELAELVAAFERGDDWTGTLTGIALLEVSADRWHVCWGINESFPVGCGSGVVLSTAPSVYLRSPEQFEAQAVDGSEPPAVIVSKSVVSVQGTFSADAALFVPVVGPD